MEKGAESSEFKGERSRKFLKSSKIVMEYQKQHYQEVRERALQGEPVIWTNVGVPYEIMYAMDIPILFNLHWSALLAAKQMAPHYLNVLNERGYFRDLCRYCSMPLGYVFGSSLEEGPWGGLPRPAALVVEIGCDPILKYGVDGEELKVPYIFGIIQ
jgi:benzoyl-CoA reductase/2-hydroxyglutaryl-CoA dehydratase subunit BcrC/BadD/HgdB